MTVDDTTELAPAGEKRAAWGTHLVLDLADCDLELISSHKAMVQYAVDIVDVIGMTAFGDPIITRHDADGIIREAVEKHATGTTVDAVATRESLIKELTEALGMLPWAVRFALHDPDAAGYTLIQPIETSLISGHFSEGRRTAYIDIFSCKPFDTDLAGEFTKGFFGAGTMRVRVLQRGDDERITP